MKHSIKQQIMMAFVGIVVFMMVIFLIMSGAFLEKYYIGNKKKDFLKVYSILEERIKSDALTGEEWKTELDRMAEQNNIAILVIDHEYKPIYVSARNKDLLANQLMGYLYNKNEQHVLEKTPEYSIVKSVDFWNGTEYIEMWGVIDKDEVFLMRSPLESIRETVRSFNRFIGMMSGVIIFISVILAWYFSRRLTQPIMELAVLSKKMANLDFDAKYTRNSEDEIGILGESFNQMSQKLEHTISDLKQANYKLQKDIEQKEQIENMRTEFLGNVSHELKTPIALIQGYAEGLKEGISDDPESRQFYCDVIMDEAGKMNKMVRNLLKLNQLEYGKADVNFTRFDITELIKGVIHSCEILISQKDAKVIFHQTESVFVWADEFKVEQVFCNYLSNALNHVKKEKVIEIKIVQEQKEARISVFNTGDPIPNGDVEYIWDKFYKVDKARTREYGGNGIGLSIVKAIMESFQKGYGVNNYDNGVEFWFELDMK